LSNAEKAELRFVAQRKNLLGAKKNKFLLGDDGIFILMEFISLLIKTFR
jgi:hypothetical protein